MQKTTLGCHGGLGLHQGSGQEVCQLEQEHPKELLPSNKPQLSTGPLPLPDDSLDAPSAWISRAIWHQHMALFPPTMVPPSYSNEDWKWADQAQHLTRDKDRAPC